MPADCPECQRLWRAYGEARSAHDLAPRETYDEQTIARVRATFQTLQRARHELLTHQQAHSKPKL